MTLKDLIAQVANEHLDPDSEIVVSFDPEMAINPDSAVIGVTGVEDFTGSFGRKAILLHGIVFD